MNDKTTLISFRADKELKAQFENLFSELGLNMSTAFNMFMRQSVREKGIPFDVSLKISNETTLNAIQEIEDMRNGRLPKNSQSVSDFIAEMGE